MASLTYYDHMGPNLEASCHSYSNELWVRDSPFYRINDAHDMTLLTYYDHMGKLVLTQKVI